MSRAGVIADLAARVIAAPPDDQAAAVEAAVAKLFGLGGLTPVSAERAIETAVRQQRAIAAVLEAERTFDNYRELAASVVSGARTVRDVASQLDTDPDTAVAVLATVDEGMEKFDKVGPSVAVRQLVYAAIRKAEDAIRNAEDKISEAEVLREAGDPTASVAKGHATTLTAQARIAMGQAAKTVAATMNDDTSGLDHEAATNRPQPAKATTRKKETGHPRSP